MKTDITVVLDRSGSMGSIKEDMEGGFDQFVREQREAEGECRLSLYKFDDEFETVYMDKSIHEVPNLDLVPRGRTALLDAIGRTINLTGERLAAMPEGERPEAVVFIVITDGHENASREFAATKIREMIKHQRGKYNWNFVFLGANQDAIETGGNYGFHAGQSMSYNANTAGVAGMYVGVSRSVTNMRAGRTMSAGQLDAFTDEDREDADAS